MKNIITLFATCILLFGTAAGEDFTRQETVTVPVASGDFVKLYNINGDVSFEKWDASDLELRYIITASDQDILDHIFVVCDIAGGLDCSVEYDDDWDDFNDSRVDFTVMLPEGTDLDIEVAFVNGDVDLQGGSGSAKLELVNGNMIIEEFDGEVYATLVNGVLNASNCAALHSAELVNGTIICQLSSLEDDLELSSVSGEILLDLKTDAMVIIETLSGDIDISEDFGAIISENYVGRSTEFGSGGHTIEINTVSGAIKVTD